MRFLHTCNIIPPNLVNVLPVQGIIRQQDYRGTGQTISISWKNRKSGRSNYSSVVVLVLAFSMVAVVVTEDTPAELFPRIGWKGEESNEFPNV